MPLVEAELLTLELRSVHAIMARAPGTHACLVMPRYASTVAQLQALQPQAILAGGRRMVQALEYMHGKGLVHMDVKVGATWVPLGGCPCVQASCCRLVLAGVMTDVLHMRG